jgi:DNA-binding transcriptional ArsR family regulator
VRAARILVLALLLPAAAGSAAANEVRTLAGDGALTLAWDGDLAHASYAEGPRAGPGDDRLALTLGVQEVRATWTGAPLGTSVDAGHRGLRVGHGAFPAAMALWDHADGAAPAAGVDLDLTADERGLDVGYQAAMLDRTAGDDPMPWPSRWYDLGAGADYGGVVVPAATGGSSDRFLGTHASTMENICGDIGQRSKVAPPDCADLVRTAVDNAPDGAVLLRAPAAALVLVLAGDPAPVALGVASSPLDAGLPGLPGIPLTPADEAPRAAPMPLLAHVAVLPQGHGEAVRSSVPATALGATVVPIGLGGDLPTALAAAALAPLLAWALYRRILPSRALQHPVREDLLRRVRAHPGIHESLLAREMGLRHTHVQYHLRVLREAGVIEERRFGGLKCIFEMGRHSSAEKAAAMTERGRSRAVLLAVADQPGIAQRDLARTLAMSESSVKWHLDRLEGSGLVRTERARGSKRVWVQPGALPAPAPVEAVPAPEVVFAAPAPASLPPAL